VPAASATARSGLERGLLYGAVRLGATSITGTVTGGTGKFRGATGTISARNLNRSGSRTGVTIHYR